MRTNLIRALVAVALALAVMGGIALATGRRPGSSADGTITACVKPQGQLRIAARARLSEGRDRAALGTDGRRGPAWSGGTRRPDRSPRPDGAERCAG